MRTRAVSPGMSDAQGRGPPLRLPGVGALDALAAAAAAQAPSRRVRPEPAPALAAIADAAAAQPRAPAHQVHLPPPHDPGHSSIHTSHHPGSFATFSEWAPPPQPALPSVQALPSISYDVRESHAWHQHGFGRAHEVPPHVQPHAVPVEPRGAGSQHQDVARSVSRPTQGLVGVSDPLGGDAGGLGASGQHASGEVPVISTPCALGERVGDRSASHVGSLPPWSMRTQSHPSASTYAYAGISQAQNPASCASAGQSYYYPVMVPHDREQGVVQLPRAQFPRLGESAMPPLVAPRESGERDFANRQPESSEAVDAHQRGTSHVAYSTSAASLAGTRGLSSDVGVNLTEVALPTPLVRSDRSHPTSCRTPDGKMGGPLPSIMTSFPPPVAPSSAPTAGMYSTCSSTMLRADGRGDPLQRAPAAPLVALAELALSEPIRLGARSESAARNDGAGNNDSHGRERRGAGSSYGARSMGSLSVIYDDNDMNLSLVDESREGMSRSVPKVPAPAVPPSSEDHHAASKTPDVKHDHHAEEQSGTAIRSLKAEESQARPFEQRRDHEISCASAVNSREVEHESRLVVDGDPEVNGTRKLECVTRQGGEIPAEVMPSELCRAGLRVEPPLLPSEAKRVSDYKSRGSRRHEEDHSMSTSRDLSKDGPAKTETAEVEGHAGVDTVFKERGREERQDRNADERSDKVGEHQGERSPLGYGSRRSDRNEEFERLSTKEEHRRDWQDGADVSRCGGEGPALVLGSTGSQTARDHTCAQIAPDDTVLSSHLAAPRTARTQTVDEVASVRGSEAVDDGISHRDLTKLSIGTALDAGSSAGANIPCEAPLSGVQAVTPSAPVTTERGSAETSDAKSRSKPKHALKSCEGTPSADSSCENHGMRGDTSEIDTGKHEAAVKLKATVGCSRVAVSSPKPGSRSQGDRDDIKPAEDDDISPSEVKDKRKERSKSKHRRKNRGKHSSAALSGDITRCPCGSTENSDYMVLCDGCNTWQHCKCMGIRRRAEVIEEYFCHICRPDEVRPRCIAHPRYKERQQAKERERNVKDYDPALSGVKPLELRRLFSSDLKLRRQNAKSGDFEELFRRYAGLFRSQFGKDKQSVIEGLVVVTDLTRIDVQHRLEAVLRKMRGSGSRPGHSQDSATPVAESDIKVWNSSSSRANTPTPLGAGSADPSGSSRPARDSALTEAPGSNRDGEAPGAGAAMQEDSVEPQVRGRRANMKVGTKRPRPPSLQVVGSQSGPTEEQQGSSYLQSGEADTASGTDAGGGGRGLSREDRKILEVMRVFQKLEEQTVRGKKKPRTTASSDSPKHPVVDSPVVRGTAPETPVDSEVTAKPSEAPSATPSVKLSREKESRDRERTSSESDVRGGLGARNSDGRTDDETCSPSAKDAVNPVVGDGEAQAAVGNSRGVVSGAPDVGSEGVTVSAKQQASAKCAQPPSPSQETRVKKPGVKTEDDAGNRRKLERDRAGKDRAGSGAYRERPRRRNSDSVSSPRPTPSALGSAAKNGVKLTLGSSSNLDYSSTLDPALLFRLNPPGPSVLRSQLVPRSRRSRIENLAEEMAIEDERKSKARRLKKEWIEAAGPIPEDRSYRIETLPAKKQWLLSRVGIAEDASQSGDATCLRQQSEDTKKEGVCISMVVVSRRECLPDGGRQLESSFLRDGDRVEIPLNDASVAPPRGSTGTGEDDELLQDQVRRAIVLSRSGVRSRCLKKRFEMFYSDEVVGVQPSFVPKPSVQVAKRAAYPLSTKSPILSLRSAPLPPTSPRVPLSAPLRAPISSPAIDAAVKKEEEARALRKVHSGSGDQGVTSVKKQRVSPLSTGQGKGLQSRDLSKVPVGGFRSVPQVVEGKTVRGHSPGDVKGSTSFRLSDTAAPQRRRVGAESSGGSRGGSLERIPRRGPGKSGSPSLVRGSGGCGSEKAVVADEGDRAAGKLSGSGVTGEGRPAKMGTMRFRSAPAGASPAASPGISPAAMGRFAKAGSQGGESAQDGDMGRAARSGRANARESRSATPPVESKGGRQPAASPRLSLAAKHGVNKRGKKNQGGSRSGQLDRRDLASSEGRGGGTQDESLHGWKA